MTKETGIKHVYGDFRVFLNMLSFVDGRDFADDTWEKVSPAKATNKAVKWTVSNKKYATVTSKGKVTVKKAGAGKAIILRFVLKRKQITVLRSRIMQIGQ